MIIESRVPDFVIEWHQNIDGHMSNSKDWNI